MHSAGTSLGSKIADRFFSEIAAQFIRFGNPVDDDALAATQQKEMGDIRNARNAAISASGNQAFRVVLPSNLTGRDSIYMPIGDGSQIAGRWIWIFGYRAIANSAGNPIVERGGHLLK